MTRAMFVRVFRARIAGFVRTNRSWRAHCWRFLKIFLSRCAAEVCACAGVFVVTGFVRTNRVAGGNGEGVRHVTRRVWRRKSDDGSAHDDER